MIFIIRLIAVLLLIPVSAYARWGSSKNSFGLTIEPVVGYERSQRLLPTPHTTDHLVYGIRMTLGFPLVAMESEYLHSNTTESDSGSDYNYLNDSLKLGARAGFRLSSVVSLMGRGGVQASQSKVTGPGLQNTSLKYYPYAGAGLRANLSGKILLSAEVVTVFTEWPDMKKNEYQPTVSLTIRFP